MKDGSMISLLILVTFTTLCLDSFSEGLMLSLSPFGSMMPPGGMYHTPLIHNHYHAPMHMMPHYGYGQYGMNHYGTAGMYHHMYRRSVPQSGKSKKRESDSKLKKEKEKYDSSSSSSEEESSEEETVRDNSKNDNDYHPPNVIVRHNGHTLFESDKCVEGKSTDKESKNQTIPNQGFPQMYPQPIIYGYPMGQQSIIPNTPMWQHSPYLEGAILDQSHQLNTLAMPPQLQSVPQLPQNQHYSLSPSLPIVPPQIPDNIHQPISPHQALPPVQPIISQHGYQQYPMSPQMMPIQQPMIQAPPPAYEHIPSQPLSPQYMTPVDQQIYQSQLMNHPQIPLHMPPSNQIHPSMVRPIVFMPQQAYHPNPQPITTTPSKLHRTPICPNPPCTSLYGKHSPVQQPEQNKFYNFLNPNRYMDSIDHIMHPYIFT